MSTYAIILSGGVGTRMQTDGIPKQYITVCGKSILMYTTETIQKTKEINEIIIVAAKEWQDVIMNWIYEENIHKFLDFAEPGDSRQESILNGLEKCEQYSESDDDNVVILDGVRAMMTTKLVSNCVKQLQGHDGSMPVVPLNDTIYQSSDCKKIDNLLDRSVLWAGQNPEGYKLKKYLEMNRRLTKEELSNIRGSSELGFRFGMDIRLFPGEDTNFKITTPADLERFRMIAEKKWQEKMIQRQKELVDKEFGEHMFDDISYP